MQYDAVGLADAVSIAVRGCGCADPAFELPPQADADCFPAERHILGRGI